jgi:hypothetical protein
MRHASITTTLAYYVGQNAEAAADAIWDAFGDTSVDTPKREENADAGRRSNHTAKH